MNWRNAPFTSAGTDPMLFRSPGRSVAGSETCTSLLVSHAEPAIATAARARLERARAPLPLRVLVMLIGLGELLFEIETERKKADGRLGVELALAESPVSAGTAGLGDFGVQTGVLRPRVQVAAGQSDRCSVQEMRTVADRCRHLETHRQLAPLHEPGVLDIAVRGCAHELVADEGRLFRESGVRVRQRAALAEVRGARLLLAAERFGAVELEVSRTPLEQRRDRDCIEERQVARDALGVRRQRRSYIGQLGQVAETVEEKLGRIDRHFGAGQLSIAVRVVVLDWQREVRTRREAFAMLLLAAVERDRWDAGAKVLDAVVQDGGRDVRAELHVGPVKNVQSEAELITPVADAAKVLEHRRRETGRRGEGARNKCVPRPARECRVLGRDPVVEESSVEAALGFRRALDFELRITGVRQDEGRNLCRPDLRDPRGEECLGSAEARAQSGLASGSAEPKLTHPAGLREESLLRDEPRRVDRGVVAQTRDLARQTAIVVRADGRRQEHAVVVRQLFASKQAERALVRVRFGDGELARGRRAGAGARRNTDAVTVVALEQVAAEAAAHCGVRRQVLPRRERASR